MLYSVMNNGIIYPGGYPGGFPATGYAVTNVRFSFSADMVYRAPVSPTGAKFFIPYREGAGICFSYPIVVRERGNKGWAIFPARSLGQYLAGEMQLAEIPPVPVRYWQATDSTLKEECRYFGTPALRIAQGVRTGAIRRIAESFHFKSARLQNPVPTPDYWVRAGFVGPYTSASGERFFLRMRQQCAVGLYPESLLLTQEGLTEASPDHIVALAGNCYLDTKNQTVVVRQGGTYYFNVPEPLVQSLLTSTKVRELYLQAAFAKIGEDNEH